MEIIEDLVKYVKEQKIQLPVILIIDGATCHISLDISRLCIENQIQPILLRANTMHLCQALDLTFFAALKAGLKNKQELWHREVTNIGSNLCKYSIMKLVYDVTEEILTHKPELIQKGFRKAGIVPWNPQAPDRARMVPSNVYDVNSGETQSKANIVEQPTK